MVAHSSQCDQAQLQRLLEDQLPETVQTEVAAHIETCSVCQCRLESFAATADVWHEMREALSDVDDDGFASHSHSIHSVPLDFLSPSDNPAMVGRIGEFEILELIGSGGMGIVLKGYDHELNRYVAVKVLHPHCATSAGARRRFAREAQAAAAVVHQHVVAIHAVGAHHHPPYLVMPFVPGESLQQRLTRLGPLEVVDVLRIGQQVAEGLAAAHAQGLVHRDIKPANILLERNVDRVLLTDFGLARAADDASLTQSGVIAGTPQFMSPEQARGENVDHRTDLFSLGTVLYTLLAGHSPFRAETAMGVLRRVCDDSPRPLRELNPSVPDWLERFIARLQAKSAADRFDSALEVAELLKGSLAHIQQPTVVPLPDAVARLVRRPLKSNRLVLWGGASVVALGVWAAGLGLWPEFLRTSIPPAGLNPSPSSIPPVVSPDSDWNDSHPQEAQAVRKAIERLEGEASDQF
ncbi:MAG: serine/threonine protein kinase [Planctomycetes bacterium]|nr:serine/threonine protein kinase [Planctomycetota bacterium]